MSASMSLQSTSSRPTVGPGAEREKAVKILAKTLYRDLRAQGYDPRHVLGLATELIAQVTEEKSESR